MKKNFIIVHNDADSTYSAGDVIGATLTSLVNTSGYSLPSTSSSVVANYKPGSVIGVVDSYIQRTDGLYWQVSRGSGKFIYLLHKAGKFSIKGQGVLTEQEKQQQEEQQKKQDEPIGTGLKFQLFSLIKSVKWLIIIALVIVIILTLLKYYPISKVLKR